MEQDKDGDADLNFLKKDKMEHLEKRLEDKSSYIVTDQRKLVGSNREGGLYQPINEVNTGGKMKEPKSTGKIMGTVFNTQYSDKKKSSMDSEIYKSNTQYSNKTKPSVDSEIYKSLYTGDMAPLERLFEIKKRRELRKEIESKQRSIDDLWEYGATIEGNKRNDRGEIIPINEDKKNKSETTGFNTVSFTKGSKVNTQLATDKSSFDNVSAKSTTDAKSTTNAKATTDAKSTTNGKYPINTKIPIDSTTKSDIPGKNNFKTHFYSSRNNSASDLAFEYAWQKGKEKWRKKRVDKAKQQAVEMGMWTPEEAAKHKRMTDKELKAIEDEYESKMNADAYDVDALKEFKKDMSEAEKAAIRGTIFFLSDVEKEAIKDTIFFLINVRCSKRSNKMYYIFLNTLNI